MHDFQDLVFRWAQMQPATTALVMLAMGLLFSLQGFRFARVLFGLTSGVGGFVVGGLLAEALRIPAFSLATGLAGVLGCAGLVSYRLGMVMSSGFVFALLTQYLAARFTANPSNLLVALVFGAALGFSLRWVCLRSLAIIVTDIQGSALLIIGFVAITSNLAPSLAGTFTGWARSVPLMIPVLMVMLFVLGYSVQANQQQGDTMTGGSKSWNNLETA